MSRSGRRKFLLAVGATAAAVGLAGGFWWRHRPVYDEYADRGVPAAPYDPAFPNRLALPGADGMFGIVDLPASLTLAAKAVRHASLPPGNPAPLLAYESEHEGRTFLNPILRVRSGTAVGIKFWNALDEESIIHWHGFKVDSNNDGHPHYAVSGGGTYDYQFTVANRAATYWYHPHPHHLTGKQTYLGLAGLFIVEDDDEVRLQLALDLKLGETDIPLLIQDKRLDAEGRPVYAPDAVERVHGYLGDQVLVNFIARPHFAATTRIYRFRIINGSNARVYRLAFMRGGQQIPYYVIGNDGGLLERPYGVAETFLSPAERLDVLLDLRDSRVGEAVTLMSLAFDPMHLESAAKAPAGEASRGHHAGHEAMTSNHAQGILPDGAAIELLKITVTRKTAYDKALPETFTPITPIDVTGARQRVLKLGETKGAWRINGLAYKLRATPIVVKRGSVEIWEIRNAARGMPHPMHVHGFQFQMLERSGSPEQQRSSAVNEKGLSAADLGWKDTLLVWPGETVRLAIDFSHAFLGDQVYMVHCHNLEHEDHGMMLNFKVAA
ncbi:MAG: multicopper oxidase domain-containing protein [Betaproteobacteria bacterium]|nr:multicopper oxidase domain-containing protein [Betaproteobacteria bacterium]